MADYSLREVFKQFGKKIFGSCVNSCVSESQNLPLAASQGKVLQDQISQLNNNKVLTILEHGFLADYQVAEKALGDGTYLYLNSHIQNFQITVISINNTLRLCGVYKIYEDLIDTAKTTKITYDAESGKVKFDSSKGACRGQLLKFNDIIVNV